MNTLRQYIEQQAETWAHLSLEDTFEQIEAHVDSQFPEADYYESRDIINDVMFSRVIAARDEARAMP